MITTTGRALGCLSAISSAVVGLALALPGVCHGAEPATRPANRLAVRLDPQGPYLILATENAARTYGDAIAKAKALHPAAAQATFAPDDLAAAGKALREHRPRYALVFILPEELDVNFAWAWLTLTTQVDDDPLVDVRTGFVTGRTPADAAAFVDRTGAAAKGDAVLPARLVDNVGPATRARPADFFQRRGNFMIPALRDRLGLSTISHGAAGFTDDRLASMDGAGLVHFGGHGHPDRIDDGLRGGQAATLKLSPCVVFNGACYTGVTGRWYDAWAGGRGKVEEHAVDPADSFCLNLLNTNAIAYLAALHPDHGIPVYQEMEFMAFRRGGASLGEVMKHTHDGVVLGNGGRLPRFERLAAGQPAPAWTAADVMLKGTAARVLFGDPALVVGDAFLDPPFAVAARQDGDGVLRVTATLSNPALMSTYADTYWSDLSAVKNLFNDRARIEADLPVGWDAVKGVQVVSVTASGKALKHRLVGYAVEQDAADGAAPGDAVRRLLHVQVDVASDAYMKSAFRTRGAVVELNVTR